MTNTLVWREILCLLGIMKSRSPSWNYGKWSALWKLWKVICLSWSHGKQSASLAVWEIICFSKTVFCLIRIYETALNMRGWSSDYFLNWARGIASIEATSHIMRLPAQGNFNLWNDKGRLLDLYIIRPPCTQNGRPLLTHSYPILPMAQSLNLAPEAWIRFWLGYTPRGTGEWPFSSITWRNITHCWHFSLFFSIQG